MALGDSKLEVSPHSGEPYVSARPNAGMFTAVFGSGNGMVVYLIRGTSGSLTWCR